MSEIDFTATIIESCPVSGGRFELVEWHWPDIVSFERTEQQLMLEMSLPPMAADASAYFPDIDPDRRCFMGALFVRHPGIAIGGRSEGRQIRVIRCVFDEPHGCFADTRGLEFGGNIQHSKVGAVVFSLEQSGAYESTVFLKTKNRIAGSRY